MATPEEKSNAATKVAPITAELQDLEFNHGHEKRRNKLRRLLWDSLDKSPSERAFVNKADWFIMSYVCITYFVKYLDQQ